MTYYIFEFDPLIGSKGSKGMVYTVYTDKHSIMEKFLRQHKMDDGKTMVQVVEDDAFEGYDIDGWNELMSYRFSSNKNGKTYDVVTSKQLVDEAYAYVVNELSSASLFGEAIAKREIPIINQCCEFIEKLDYGVILDLDDGEDDYDFYKRPSRYRPNLKTGTGNTPTDEVFYTDGPDDSIIADMLYDEFQSTPPYEPQVITVEAYTAFFVSLITDSVS